MAIEWSLQDFDSKGRQKPPAGLLLTLLCLSRHLLILAAGSVSRKGTPGQHAAFDAVSLAPGWALPLSIFSLVLLLLVLNRPRLEGRAWWRRLMGALVPISLTLGIAQIILIGFLKYPQLLKLDWEPALDMGLVLVCGYYLMTSAKLHHFIRECVKAPEAKS